MKKTILFGLVFMLMTTFAYAEVESVTKTDDLPFESAADTIQCEYYTSDRKMYCFGLPTPGARDTIWTYDLDTQIIENKTAVLPIPTTWWGNYWSLWYYDDQMWSLSSDEKAFKYDIVGDNLTNLSGANSNLPDILQVTCCEVDEGTDDVYCVASDNMFKYEMDTDTYTALTSTATFSNQYSIGDLCDYDQVRDKMYYVNPDGYSVYAYDVAGDSHSLVGSFPTTEPNPSDPTTDGIRNGYCDYLSVNNKLYCFIADDDNYQYSEIFYIDVTSGTSGIDDTELHLNISYSTCDRINETSTVCMFGYYDHDNWYESDDVFYITYLEIAAAPEAPSVAEEEEDENIGGNIIALQNLQRSQRAAVTPVNPITQFILNLRAAILRLFGIEG